MTNIDIYTISINHITVNWCWEWVIVAQRQLSIFQLYRYHGENKLIFRDNDEAHFVLDQHA